MNKYLFNYSKKAKYTLLVGDIFFITLSIIVSYFIRVYLTYKDPTIALVITKLSLWLFPVILFHVFILYLMDQYNLDGVSNIARSLVMVISSVWLAGLVISGSFFFVPKYVFGRQVLIIHLLVLSIFLVVWRILYSEILFKRSKPKRVALIGDGQILSSFVEELTHVPKSGLKITEVCVSNGKSGVSCPLTPSFTERSTIYDLLNSNDFDVLAFDATNGHFTNDEIRCIFQAKCDGKVVYDLPTIYKNLTGKVPVTFIDGRWLLHSTGFQGQYNIFYARTKRIFDIVLSAILLILLAPLFGLIALANKADSKGRVFFVQERIGLHQKPFRCFKFRTMIENAEEISGPIWSQKEDPRITRVGKFLKKQAGRITTTVECPYRRNEFRGTSSNPRIFRKATH